MSSELQESPIRDESYTERNKGWKEIGYGYGAKLVIDENQYGEVVIQVRMRDLDNSNIRIGESVVKAYKKNMPDSELRPYVRKAIADAQSYIAGTTQKAHDPMWLNDYLKKQKK